MVRAFVLIEMAAGHSTNLVNTLRGRSDVVEADRVTGPYDVIAVLEAADLVQINEVVTTEIHHLEGVVRTITCVSLEP